MYRYNALLPLNVNKITLVHCTSVSNDDKQFQPPPWAYRNC